MAPTVAGRRIAAVLLALALIWPVAIVAAPVLAGAGSVPARLGAGLVYGAAARVCHQRPERSFDFAGRPWAVCGRCAGLYAGAAAVALLAFLSGPPLRDGRWRLWFALAAAPTGALWLIEYAAGLDPTTPVRAAGALPLGAAVAAALAVVAWPPVADDAGRARAAGTAAGRTAAGTDGSAL